MAFNLDQFEKARFEPRTERVLVEGLAPFFAEGEEAAFVVRGLSSSELHVAMEAGKRQATIEAVVSAIASKTEQVAAIRKAIGLSKDTPGEIAKRLEMLVAGAVEPKLSLPQAVKIAEAFPIEFMQLTNAITLLTGKGFEMGKPEASSRKKKD
jgi:hypothetical protein